MLLTDEQVKKIKGFMKQLETSEKEIQVNEDNTFKVIASTESEDRHGDIVRVDGWDIENFMKNPVIVIDHNWTVENIVWKATKIYTEDDKLIVEWVFTSTWKGQLVNELYNGWFLKAVSVGFLPKQYEDEKGSIISKQELYELSFVAIPANPEALSLDEKKLVDTYHKNLQVTKKEMKQKSLNEMIKESVMEDLNISEDSNEKVYVCEIFVDKVIVNNYKYTEDETFDVYYEYNYEISEDKAVVSNKTEVEPQVMWTEVTKNFKKSKENNKLDEILAITSNIESKLLSVDKQIESDSTEVKKEVEKEEEVEVIDNSNETSIKALESILEHFKNKNS